MLFYSLMFVSAVCPFLVFLDYRKRHNVRWGVMYVVSFLLFFIFVFPQLILTPESGLVFAGSIPLLMAILLTVKKLRGTRGRKNDSTVIADF